MLGVWSGLLTWRIALALGRLWSCKRGSTSGCRMSCSTRVGSNVKSPALGQPERMFWVGRVALRVRSYNRAKCCSPSCWLFCGGAAPSVRGTLFEGRRHLRYMQCVEIMRRETTEDDVVLEVEGLHLEGLMHTEQSLIKWRGRLVAGDLVAGSEPCCTQCSLMVKSV